MGTQRDIVLPISSHCQFLCLSNAAIMSKRMHIVISVRGIVQLFPPLPLQNSKGTPFSGAPKHSSGGNFAIIASCLKNAFGV